MEDQRISTKTALLAVQKGCDLHSEKCIVKHNDTDKILDDMWYDSLNRDVDTFMAFKPTQTALQRYLREEKKLWAYCVPAISRNGLETRWLAAHMGRHSIDDSDYTYEEALEIALQYLLTTLPDAK